MNQFIFKHLILVVRLLCGEGALTRARVSFSKIAEGTRRVTEEDGEYRSNETEWVRSDRTFYHRKITTVALTVIGVLNGDCDKYSSII